MAGRSEQPANERIARVREIGGQLRDLEERLDEAATVEVQMSLLEHGAELAEEAARLLEQIDRAAD
jgi:acyl-CoA reductase-like NAD-dependent aldehyde dehydrogenase